jgi:amino acid transporter
MFLAFLPMLFIAGSYYHLNRADPDCGTTFAWVTRAMGRTWAGWRLGHHRGRHRRHGQPGPDRRQVAFLLLNAEGLAENVFWITASAASSSPS